jgi:3-oxoacyl-[acyl-carrier-protein] synthase III
MSELVPISSVVPYRLAVKSVKSLVPGHGAEGAPFGVLVPTTEILAGIRPRRKPRRSESRDQHVAELPFSLLETLLGFKSIATTNITHRVASAAIGSGLDWEKLTAAPKPGSNSDLEAMLSRVTADVVEQHARREGGKFSASKSIFGHIHIASTTNLRTPYALLEARHAARCHKPGLPLVTLLSGCSGLLFALQHAFFLLREDAALADDSAFVLITCSNDLLPFAHARALCPPTRNERLDDWLFQAIFGEGVGAVVVGHGNRGGDDWVIEDVGMSPVTDDWRVTMNTTEGVDAMMIRSREVGITFREHVPRAAQRGLASLGMRGFGDLHRLCIHESNPRLVAYVQTALSVPPDCVHTVSAEVGTLAGVSAFSLLDEALSSFSPQTPQRDKVVCALIGESGDSVVAGHIALRYAHAAKQTSADIGAHVEQLESTA